MTRKFDRTILDLIEGSARNFKALPLNLGAVAGSGGGIGSPPGGYIGWLPQTRVAYDEEELATLDTSISGSLLDNLNHIRYRLGQVEASSGVLVIDDWDGSPSINPTDRITFSGVIVTDLGGGHALITVTSSGGGIGEAPINGSGYMRKDGGWVLASGGGTSLTVQDYDGNPNITNVNTITFSGANITNLGGGNALVAIVASGTGTPLTVEEYDGSPSVTNVDKIIFSGATVTSLGSGDVLITVSSGGNGTPLTVEDYDGSPSITNVDKIIFSGAIITDNGSGDVLVAFSGSATEDYLHIYNEDLTPIADTTVFTTNRIYASGTLRVYYRGLRQRKTVHYLDDVNFVTFSTYFTVSSGESLVVDYDYLLSSQIDTTHYLLDSDGILIVDSDGIQLTES